MAQKKCLQRVYKKLTKARRAAGFYDYLMVSNLIRLVLPDWPFVTLQ